MALIKCPDCEKEVSDQAPTCPNCGRIIKEQTVQTTKGTKLFDPMENARGCIRVIAIIFALFAVGYFVSLFKH